MSLSASKGTITIGGTTHAVEAEKWQIYARAAELAPLAKLILAQAEAFSAAVDAAQASAVRKDVTALDCRIMARLAGRTADRLQELITEVNDDALLTACMAAAKAEGEQAYNEYLLASEQDEKVR